MRWKVELGRRMTELLIVYWRMSATTDESDVTPKALYCDDPPTSLTIYRRTQSLRANLPTHMTVIVGPYAFRRVGGIMLTHAFALECSIQWGMKSSMLFEGKEFRVKTNLKIVEWCVRPRCVASERGIHSVLFSLLLYKK